ncbi:MAG TPA: hypothetical protein VKA83_09160 [Methylomirabilota bacterium]|nr:hypothetical protein [Methylomirabilota bacterium]
MNILQREVLVELHIVVFRDEGFKVSGVSTSGTKLLPNTPENRIKATFALLAAVQDWAAQAGVDLHLPIQEGLDAAMAELVKRHYTPKDERTVWHG